MKTSIGVALAAALTLSASATAPAAPSPELTLVALAPLTVHGAGFKPGELVTVSVLVSNRPRKMMVRAGIRGGFRATVRFVGRPCGRPLAVTATGANGDAVLRLPAPICIPPPID